jgi:hypothetical protein
MKIASQRIIAAWTALAAPPASFVSRIGARFRYFMTAGAFTSIFILFASSAVAQQAVTYTYTGNPFELQALGFTNVSGSISFQSASAGGYNFNYCTVGGGCGGILAYSFTDGVDILNQNNSIIYGDLFTGTNGAVNQWQLEINSNATIGGGIIPVNEISTFSNSQQASDGGDYETFCYSPNLCTGYGGVNVNSPGTWSTTAPIPPPPPTTLFSAAFIASADSLSNELAQWTDPISQYGMQSTYFAPADAKSLVGAFLGLIDISPQAQQDFDQTTLNLGNMALSLGGVAISCTAGAFLAETPCVAAVVGAVLTDAQTILSAIEGGDPPDPNYTQVFAPTLETPPGSVAGACTNLDTALQAAPYAVDQVNDWLYAIYVTNNRYQTALGADDSASEDLQESVFQTDLGDYDAAAQTAGTDLTCLSQLLAASDTGTQLTTAQEEANSLAFLESQDPTSFDFVLSSLGFTPTDTATLLADIEADPTSLSTEDLVDGLNGAGQALQATAVPEPPSVLLLLPGLVILGAVLYRRRRRRFGEMRSEAA